MVIASRPKTQPPAHHKKRHGQHHRQTKEFTKTYWPYLPVVALAVAINAFVGQQSSLTTTASTTRIEAWTNFGPGFASLIALIAAAALAVFLTRHARIWHRVLVKSEAFIEHNRRLDLLLLTVAAAGFIVTRAV